MRQNLKEIEQLLLLTKYKGYSRHIRQAIIDALNDSEEEQYQIEEMTKIMQNSKNEEDAIQAIKSIC